MCTCFKTGECFDNKARTSQSVGTNSMISFCTASLSIDARDLKLMVIIVILNAFGTTIRQINESRSKDANQSKKILDANSFEVGGTRVAALIDKGSAARICFSYRRTAHHRTSN